MNLIFRPITSSDLLFLEEMLYQAIYVPPGQPVPPRAVLALPEVRQYIEGWGRAGDLGLLALDGETPAGAAWLRLFSSRTPGYGYVDAYTPELSIALLPAYRQQGIGSRLLEQLLAAAQEQYAAVSLSVASENPAQRLYARLGFQVVDGHNGSVTMLRRFDGSTALAQQLALLGDRLRDISASGLAFAESIYERQNYSAVQEIAIQLLALSTGTLPVQLEPLRAAFLERWSPHAVGDAAVIDDQGRMLLIQRADNHKWAMPGGILEAGETPAEGVAREALEEAGVRCRAEKLVGVFDSRLCGSLSPLHLYSFVFLCRVVEGAEPEPISHANEILDVGWFPEDALPAALSPGHAVRIAAAYRTWHGEEAAFFDRPNAA